VRVNQNGGYFDFSRIAASEIERVEVVRGAQSSLWGSDAIGAVVQIFTRRAGAGDAPQITGSTEAGSFATWRGDARLTGGARQRIDYHAGISYGRTAGAFSDILPEDDRFDQATIDAGFGAALGTRASLRSTVRYSNAEGRAVGNIAFGARDTGTAYDTKDFSWHLDASHTAGTRYTGRATVMYFRNDGLSSDTIADPSFDVYALLSGEPGAIFPRAPRLVRLLDRGEFESLSQSPDALAAGQFLAFTPGAFDSDTRNRLHHVGQRCAAGRLDVGGRDDARRCRDGCAALRAARGCYDQRV
jgi:outer membrane receptor protein involved in Fe transport